MQTAYDIYESTKTQIEGLCAERNALILALAAKQQQVDGLVAERDELRELLTAARSLVVRWRRAYCGHEPVEEIGGTR